MANKKIRIIGSDYTPVDEASVSSPDLAEIPNGLVESFVRKQTEHLIKKDKIYLTDRGNELKFKGYVGVIRGRDFEFGDEHYDVTLQIKSRFDKSDKNGKSDKAYFLAAMLLSEDDIEKKLMEDRVEISYDDIFEVLLLYLFQTQLEAAAAKGIYRKYVRFENNDSRPHGVIDISRHIRENVIVRADGKIISNGRIAYSYRELTANNGMNRLILAAYDRLKSKYPTLTEEHIGRRHMPFIKTLRTELGFRNMNTRGIVSENLNPIAHPYYHEYEDLRKTCLKILRDDGVSLFDAECSDDVESLLIYVPTLWERFLTKCFKERIPKEITVDTHGGNNGNGEKYISPHYCNAAQPDLVFYRDKTPIAILDAKFRKPWSDFFDKGAKEWLKNDIDKCIRDMVVFNTRRTGIIAPCLNGSKVYRDKLHEKYDDGPFFDMVGITVPEIGLPDRIGHKSFPDWYEEFKKYTNNTLDEYISECLKENGN